jgi:hypothetical protein
MAEQITVAGDTSQVSPLSTTPLPHTAAQSVSLLRLQALGQQPSPLVQAVTAACVQATLHVAFAPVRVSVVHASPSLQLMLEQITAAGDTSQVSPLSMRPLPQPGQSTSIVGPHPVGQKPSAGPQARAVVVQTYVQAVTLPDDVRTLFASDTHAVICVMQVLDGSHVSPDSTRPLPQPGQSMSLVGPHPVGQKPSAGPHARAVAVQRYVQAVTLPDDVRTLSASETHAAICAVHMLGGSHVSLADRSTTPLPHTGWQSLSFVELHADGQQLSPFMHAVCRLPLTHWTLQAAGLPMGTRSWHPMAAQDVGQLPSQSSPASTTPFPQRTTQSASFVALQPLGQHESFGVQAVVVAPFTQRASQVAALPCSVRCWQPTAGHDVGQLLPSHISPGSTTPFPQRGEQSVSLMALQPVGQQPSPFMHAVCMPAATHAAWHVPAPVSVRSWQPCAGHAVGHIDSGSHVSPGSRFPLPQAGDGSVTGTSVGGRSMGASIVSFGASTGAVSPGRSTGVSSGTSSGTSIGTSPGGKSASASPVGVMSLPLSLPPDPSAAPGRSAPPSNSRGVARRPPHPAPTIVSSSPNKASFLTVIRAGSTPDLTSSPPPASSFFRD